MSDSEDESNPSLAGRPSISTTTATTTTSERVLEARKDFQNALEKIKGLKGSTRLNIDPQEMEEVCNELCKQMETAAEKDQMSIKDGRAGLEKQKMLQDVLSFLDREPLHEIMLDSGILQPIRVWMEPLIGSKSLPNTNFRLALLNKLRLLPIDTDYLRESGGLGRLVMFFACREGEDPKIQRISKELISVWSRPIIAMSISSNNNGNSTTTSTMNDSDDFQSKRRAPQILRSKALLNHQRQPTSPQSFKKTKFN